MFFDGNPEFFTSEHLVNMLAKTVGPRKQRWLSKVQPKAIKMYAVSPPWKSVPDKLSKCFKAK